MAAEMIRLLTLTISLAGDFVCICYFMKHWIFSCAFTKQFAEIVKNYTKNEQYAVATACNNKAVQSQWLLS